MKGNSNFSSVSAAFRLLIAKSPLRIVELLFRGGMAFIYIIFGIMLLLYKIPSVFSETMQYMLSAVLFLYGLYRLYDLKLRYRLIMNDVQAGNEQNPKED